MAKEKREYAIDKWRNVCILQQVERGFDADFIDKLVKDWSCVKDYAYIVHDKDNDDNIHIHCAIRFQSNVHTSVLLNRCDKIKEGVITFQCLNKCDWKGTLLYFTHQKYPEKAQYKISDIVSNCDVERVIKKALEKSPDVVLDEIKAKIKSGECRPFNVHHFCNEDIYSKYGKLIDGYFKYNQLVLNEKYGGNRDMRLMYFQGDSECGKTTFAKKYCEGKEWSYYISSGGANPLDNYGGQDCIILDDFRPSDYKFNEFLKLTDNHTSSMAHCRYYNKSLVYCRCIIVTSTVPIDIIYNNVTMSDDKEKEEARQLKRRFGEVYEFHKDNIDIYIYDSNSGTHKFFTSAINPVGALFSKRKEEELRKKVSDVLGIFGVTLPNLPDGFTQLDMLPDDLPF